MKAQPLKLGEGSYIHCEADEATHIMLCLPGPIPTRIIPVMIKGSRKDTGNWTWNGDTELPTLKPSVRSTDGHNVCHTFITDGKVIFLGDCTHELANQTLDLLEVDY